MYFGSVKFFKHLIVGVTLLLIIVPWIFIVLLNVKLSESEEQIKELKADVGELKLSGHQLSYTPEELFSLYKENLENKQGFLDLAYQYDESLYKAAAGIEKDVETSSMGENAITAAPSDSQPITESGTVDIIDEPEESTAPIEPAHPYEALYPELYADIPENIVYDQDMDYVYLTFDDGPSRYTENILEYLRAYDIKATFFVIPDGSPECNARLKSIADAGHTIGIHTASHEYNKIYSSVEAYLEDFKTAYDRVYEATGLKCTLFRFPGGSINDYNGEIRDDLIAEMTRRGFVYFDWNVDSNDAMGATWTEMYNNVLSETAANNRSVVLMHDYNGGVNTILVLEDIIKALIANERGYKLAKLTETVKPVQF